jgi:pyruvate/2-oxoglutarate dehydrogenase complex dihydrolipoamide dehydrogenase (E3) component
VTVIAAGAALSREDPELVRIVLARIRAEGVEIRENTRITRVERRGRAAIMVHVEDEAGDGVVQGTRLLVVAGRRPAVEGLGLDKARIAQGPKGIRVDERLRTTNRRVYAIGDVAGGPQFTHVAAYHAGLVIRSILFRLPARQRAGIIPWVTFTDPELAHVGLTEEEARKRERRIEVLRWPYAENDRAQAERQATGMIKLVADRRGRILGVSIVGAHAGELIGMWSLAVARSMRLADMTGYIAPYPTYGEIGKRAVISYYSGYARKPIVRRIIGLLRRLG